MTSALGGSLAIPSDFAELTALWSNPTVIAGVRALGWKADPNFDWSPYRTFISRDGSGIRFAIVTRPNVVDLVTASQPGEIHLDEEDWIWVGPRPGLTAQNFLVAAGQVLRTWFRDASVTRLRPASTVMYGLIPANFNANFKNIYTQRATGAHIVDLQPGEWPAPIPQRMTLIYHALGEWDAILKRGSF